MDDLDVVSAGRHLVEEPEHGLQTAVAIGDGHVETGDRRLGVAGPSSQEKRPWSWWESTGPARRKLKPGKRSWTAAIVASMASRPFASASGST